MPPCSRLSPRYMTNGVVAEERLGGQHRVGEPGGLVLDDVGDRHAELRAVAGRRADLVAGLGRDDDPDLLDPGVGHRLDAVEEHRLVGDRHELLGARVGDRAQARAAAAREDQALEAVHAVAEGNGAAPGGVGPCPGWRRREARVEAPGARAGGPQGARAGESGAHAVGVGASAPGVAEAARAAYAPRVRSVRITGLGLALLGLAAAAIVAMLTVDRLVVPGGVVLGLVLLLLAGDGTMLRAVDGLTGQHRVEEQPGPRRPRFRPRGAAGVARGRRRGVAARARAAPAGAAGLSGPAAGGRPAAGDLPGEGASCAGCGPAGRSGARTRACGGARCRCRGPCRSPCRRRPGPAGRPWRR